MNNNYVYITVRSSTNRISKFSPRFLLHTVPDIRFSADHILITIRDLRDVVVDTIPFDRERFKYVYTYIMYYYNDGLLKYLDVLIYACGVFLYVHTLYVHVIQPNSTYIYRFIYKHII